MNWNNIKAHPLAEELHSMTAEEKAALLEDIRENKLREKIVIYEGMILDGRHRYDCLKKLSVRIDENSFRLFDPSIDGDPAQYVISLNLVRRNLSLGQRAAAASELLKHVKKSKGGRPKEEPVRGNTEPVRGSTDKPVRVDLIEMVKPRGSALGAKENSDVIPSEFSEAKQDAAKKLKVHPDSVKKFATVEKRNPDLAQKVKSGVVTLNEAYSGVRERKEVSPTQAKKAPMAATELIKRAWANENGGACMKWNGVIVAVFASPGSQEDFATMHGWPFEYTEECFFSKQNQKENQ